MAHSGQIYQCMFNHYCKVFTIVSPAEAGNPQHIYQSMACEDILLGTPALSMDGVGGARGPILLVAAQPRPLP